MERDWAPMGRVQASMGSVQASVERVRVPVGREQLPGERDQVCLGEAYLQERSQWVILRVQQKGCLKWWLEVSSDP